MFTIEFPINNNPPLLAARPFFFLSHAPTRRVAASICRQHVPGCSLDLSAGRQTKIEVMRSNQLGPRSVPSPGCASQPPDPRYVAFPSMVAYIGEYSIGYSIFLAVVPGAKYSAASERTGGLRMVHGVTQQFPMR